MPRTLLLGAFALCALISCTHNSSQQKSQSLTAKPTPVSKDTTATEPLDSLDAFGLEVDKFEVDEYTIQRNESLYLILDNLDFSPQEIYSISEEAKNIIDPKKMKPGQPYYTYSKGGSDSSAALAHLVWQPNSMEYVVFDWQQDSLEIYKAARPLFTQTAVTTGEIENSLYQTISHNGGSPMLAHKLSTVFAWQIDFFSIRSGDTFKTLYEERYVDDQFFGVGDLLAAQIKHRGKMFRAYYFSKGDFEGYYTEEGESVQRALLKAPFEYDHRISSPFSKNRMHPTLNRRRPHNGVDYAAPSGTPILSTGQGVVQRAGYYGGAGNMVEIKHNKTYETTYMHMRAFADGVHPGAHVEQGQVIGYVGTTGRSTGPHLHYEVSRNRKAINPLTMDLPSSESIPDSLMADFEQVRDTLDEQLNEKENEQEQENPVLTYTDNATL
ncbi:M23 family metallopeptidase [Fodinibius salsisoli]|uniref:Peptidoglycan DD-metalloendopeptidase family protein n=1 Tax=Fodinibius salsisoli TaxID=2820877 RepID=A0ABT3PN58_9BACT|nr:peptidoglycan DD-metalloendopeptidase family protein [Fodinibius salsisoli]MCW9707339.1 peptidoglycan DD-metalloendopeptidase family protein [Fodinibius salsisoli]